MMDYGTRIILATILGLMIGYGLHRFLFFDLYVGLIIGVAVSVASETSLRTIKNVKAPSNKVLDNTPKEFTISNNDQGKPPKMNF